MYNIGFTGLDNKNEWVGGKYYLHHLIKCLSGSIEESRCTVKDVWWGSAPSEDPFLEVRQYLDGQLVLTPPGSMFGRVKRKIKKGISGNRGIDDLLREGGIDVLFPWVSFKGASIPYVSWIPDFHYLYFRDTLDKKIIDQFEKSTRERAYQSTRVVVSSSHGKNDFLNLYPDLEHKVDVLRFCSVPDAVWYKNEPAVVAEQYDIQEPYFIVCNQFSHHKNHMILLRTLKVLKDKGKNINIVFTGSQYDFSGQGTYEAFMKYAEDNKLLGNIKVLGLIPREDQIALLRASLAILQPSNFEGWSTIVEDGKTLGKTILLSDISVHLEQIKEVSDAYPLPGDNPNSWAECIEYISDNNSPNGTEREKASLQRLEERKQQCGTEFLQIVSRAVEGKQDQG